ncbi:MAG: ATP-dependent Clp protease ATP-binding subunit ClpA, partial [Beijerinckiaceae bacterium]
TDEARAWLVEHGYDDTMGARPMARLIQQVIKTPLADEVLFGRLKDGGAVRVMLTWDEVKNTKVIGFDFPETPIVPRPEPDVRKATRAKEKQAGAKAGGAKASQPPKHAAKKRGRAGGDDSPDDGPGDDGSGGKGSGVRTVPKLPLSRS